MRTALRTILLGRRAAGGAAPVDGLLDFETASAGDMETVARLNAATRGGGVTWSLSRDPLLFTKVGSNNQALGFNVSAGGASYSGSGTRALLIDLDAGVVAAASPAYETIIGTPTSTWGDLTLEFMFRIPALFPRTGTDTDIDLFTINAGGIQAIFQLHQDGFGSEPIKIRSHGSGSPARGPNISVTANVWYRGTVRANKTSGRAEIAVASSGTIIGASSCPSALADVETFTFGSYLTFTGGTIEVDNVIWNHTTAPLPIGPLALVAPTVAAEQTNTGEVTATWDAVGTLYLVERNKNSVGWTTLQSGYALNSYVDTDIAGGDAVQYRVTATVGSRSSAAGTSATVDVESSTPFLVSQTLGSTGSGFDGYLGCKLTVGATDMVVSQLGLWVLSGDAGIRSVEIRNATGTVIATVNVDRTGQPVGYAYAACSVTLSAGGDYYILRRTETGDSWYSSDTTATASADATLAAAVYSSSSSGIPGVNNPGACLYGPVNMEYALAP